MTDSIKEILSQDPEFQKLESFVQAGWPAYQARRASLAYEESLRKYRDTIAVMEGQYQDGMEKGRAEEKYDIARKLRQMGMSDVDITSATGLSEKDLAQL